RKQSAVGATALQRAARFVYLNRHCFNGVYRTNREGAFNVPFGRSVGALPDVEAFRAVARVLKRSSLRAGDFEETVADATRGDFVYLDPPFFGEGRAAFGEYGYEVFGSSDIGRFGRFVNRLDSAGVKVL